MRGIPVPTPSVKAQVIEERVDLSNNMTGRQMIGVGVRRVVLARGELDKLEGPKYAAGRAELRRERRGRRSRESKGPTGGGGAEELGRGERRDRGRSDRRENDESGKTAGWHEGCSENRRGTTKRDRKRQTPDACLSPLQVGCISDVLPQGGCVPGSGDEGRGRRPRVGDG